MPGRNTNTESLNNNSIYLFLALLILSVYLPALNFEFVWDDHEFLENNKFLKNLKNIPTFFLNADTFAKSKEAYIYRPLRNILWTINLAVSDTPFFFHLQNIILHILVSCLFFRFLSRAPGLSKLNSFIAAAFYAIHPLNTETVAWIKSVDDILAALFIILMLIFIHKKKLKTAIVCYFCGMLSKESAFFFFAAPLFLNNMQNKKNNLLRIIPFLLTGILYFILRSAALGSFSQSLYLDGWKTPFYMGGTFLNYLIKILWPFDLRVNYIGWHPSESFNTISIILFWIFLIISSVILLRSKSKNYYALFVLAVIPISNLIPMMQWMAERFSYLPLIFLIITLTSFLRSINFFRKHIKYLQVTFSLIIFCFALISANRIQVWKNDLTLGYEILRKNPYSYPALILILNYNEDHNLYEDNLKLLNNIKGNKDSESEWFNYYYEKARKYSG